MVVGVVVYPPPTPPPSLLLPFLPPLRSLKGTKGSRLKADQACGGWKERGARLGKGWRWGHWQGLASTCRLQVLAEGRGDGGLSAASGTGLAVPIETLVGRGAVA